MISNYYNGQITTNEACSEIRRRLLPAFQRKYDKIELTKRLKIMGAVLVGYGINQIVNSHFYMAAASISIGSLIIFQSCVLAPGKEKKLDEEFHGLK